ncbi:transporter [Metabacillus fastidiosus]|uniref:transporter n=1 Tax=Metabacillus fastidiosus TaxID=1458 RepID=UPI002DBF1373|nr:transporter [Metabacillus fastidiosus]MEC2075176.1 transporter [Metabacillus fastidiosus]
MYPYDRQIPGFPNFGGQNQFPGSGQMQPPFGPPPFGGPQGGFGQGGIPQGGFGQGGPPQGPPPSTIPPETQVSAFAVDPGGIRRCLYRYTFIRLNNGRGFWFYPTFVGRTSVAGYRWRPRQFRWDYFGIDLNRIRSFSCS